MPAPAPCAKTKQQLASRPVWLIPETTASSFTLMDTRLRDVWTRFFLATK